MRTLIVTLDPAFPPRTDADFRAWQIAQAAAALGPTLLLSLAAAAKPSSPLPGAIAAVALSGLDPASLVQHDPETGLPVVSLPADARPRLTEIIRAFTPDTVVLEGLGLHPLLELLKEASKAHLVVDLDDVATAQLAAAAGAIPPWRFARRREARRAAAAAAALEREVAAKAAIWFETQNDARRFAAVAPEAKAVVVVPLRIPRPEAAPGALQPVVPAENGQAATLLFTGDLGKPLNVEAIQWLVMKILPRIRKRRAGTNLVLAGPNPTSVPSALAQTPGVRLAPDSEDQETTLAAADIAVLPVAQNARFAALEAMSRGLALVATPAAVDGLDLIAGQHYFAATNAKDFSHYISKLIDDLAAREKMRRAAWQHCLRHYGPAAVTRSVQRALNSGGDTSK
ncbi:MAG: glycosyltransferase [Rhodospirillaceae bacterium]|nr:glycosyltransferase [Rhodospirillaceae bacterium]